jgi:hypothetical protein
VEVDEVLLRVTSVHAQREVRIRESEGEVEPENVN